jgi:DsbE subfamily thiol:disulfide oxidoreductase
MLKRWLSMGGLLAVIGVATWYALPSASSQVVAGRAAPAFSLPDLSGHLKALPKGQVVLLNFWATWCPPCRQEMPSMVTLYEKLKEKGLKVVAVSVDQNSSELASFVREYGIPFEVLHDQNSQVSQRYGVYRYPESFLIDRSGRVRYHLIGSVEWMSPQVMDNIQSLLNEQHQG